MFTWENNDLVTEFATGLAKQALGDIEATFDRALKRASGGGQSRALANLREKCVHQLERIAKGRDGRLPSAVLDEALDGIHRILTGDTKEAIAKAASGPGRREAMHHVEHADARKLEGEALVQACIKLAKEFRELAQPARRAMKKLGAELAFDVWEKRYHHRIAAALHKQDLQTVEIEMADARRSLNALLDQAQVDAALAAK